MVNAFPFEITFFGRSSFPVHYQQIHLILHGWIVLISKQNTRLGLVHFQFIKCLRFQRWCPNFSEFSKYYFVLMTFMTAMRYKIF